MKITHLMRAASPCLLLAAAAVAQPGHEVAVSGTAFRLDGKDFPWTGISFFNAIIKELIPHVDANWRTFASKPGRAIDGFSMGGCGALMLAFKHPELFSSVVPYGAALVTFDRLRGQE